MSAIEISPCKSHADLRPTERSPAETTDETEKNMLNCQPRLKTILDGTVSWSDVLDGPTSGHTDSGKSS
jgi:hypothetical protein